MSELRKDPIIRRWIILSKERNGELSDYISHEEKVEKSCPFCPGNEEKTPVEIMVVRKAVGPKDRKDWSLRVIPDKFPLLRIEGGLEKRGQGIYDIMNAVGAHEVIIETPEHDTDWAILEIEQIKIILEAYRGRSLDLRKDKRFKHIIIVKNQGWIASQWTHPHSHVLAMPFIVKRVEEELNSSGDYFKIKERCIYCDIINEEIHIGKRVIIESDYFLVFAPFASKFPYEICVIPKLHISDLSAINEEILKDQAKIFKEVVIRLKKVFRNLSYSMVLHSSPIQRGLIEEYHWHWEIMPRYREAVGFEWGTGLYANPVLPEDAAKILRDAGL